MRRPSLAAILLAALAGPAAAQPAVLPPTAEPPPAPVEVTAEEEQGGPKGAAPAPGAAPAAPAAKPALPPGPRWITPLPRTGPFLVPPTGCGYYSVLDQLRGEERKAAPKSGNPRFSLIQQPFFDADWRYLKDAKNTDHDYLDHLKWIPVADGVTVNLGGDLRYRLMQSVNANNRLNGVVDNHDLYRVRTYADVWFDDRFRLFAEGTYSEATRRTDVFLPTDADRGDIQNLFLDARVWEFGEGDNPVYVRAGRQELLYGSQRLLSTLEWVNTRRTFQGVKAFTRTEKWDFDLFVVQPVIPNAGRFDSVDNNQILTGAWFTRRPAAGQTFDLYYLNLDNTNQTARGQFGAVGGQNVNTVGARYVGAKNNWLWDAEAMVQFGSYANQSIAARAFTVLGGYHFKDVPWEPQVWVGYDYASGDPDPQNSGTRRTFNQLFPFGHNYLGFTDVAARQNITDYNAQLAFFPEKWLTCMVQYHVLRLDSDRDALYAPGGAVLRQDRTGRAGNDIGNNLDLRCNVHVSTHSDVLFGYSRLFAGDFIRNTATGPNRGALATDPEQFYLQYTYRW